MLIKTALLILITLQQHQLNIKSSATGITSLIILLNNDTFFKYFRITSTPNGLESNELSSIKTKVSNEVRILQVNSLTKYQAHI